MLKFTQVTTSSYRLLRNSSRCG